MVHHHLIKRLPGINPESIIEFFEERAAIREHEAGMHRSLAEQFAFQDTIKHFYLDNHIINTTNL